jgi:hypothetical protein
MIRPPARQGCGGGAPARLPPTTATPNAAVTAAPGELPDEWPGGTDRRAGRGLRRAISSHAAAARLPGCRASRSKSGIVGPTSEMAANARRWRVRSGGDGAARDVSRLAEESRDLPGREVMEEKRRKDDADARSANGREGRRPAARPRGERRCVTFRSTPKRAACVPPREGRVEVAPHAPSRSRGREPRARRPAPPLRGSEKGSRWGRSAWSGRCGGPTDVERAAPASCGRSRPDLSAGRRSGTQKLIGRGRGRSDHEAVLRSEGDAVDDRELDLGPPGTRDVIEIALRSGVSRLTVPQEALAILTRVAASPAAPDVSWWPICPRPATRRAWSRSASRRASRSCR